MLAATMSIPFLESFLGDWLNQHTSKAVKIPRKMTELLSLPQLSELLPPEVVWFIFIPQN